MLWVPIVLVGALLSAALFYVLASEWALRRRAASPGAADGRASALPLLGKVGAFLIFWVASVEAVFASWLLADPSVLGFASTGLLFVAGWSVLARAPRATALLALAVAVTTGAGWERSREFSARAERVLEYRNPREKENPCCGPNPGPACLSQTNPCAEGFMQAWTNAAASLIYRTFAHVSTALGGIGFLSLLFTLWKTPTARARFECRKCGKVTTRAERTCPKCGAIETWKSR